MSLFENNLPHNITILRSKERVRRGAEMTLSQE